MVMVEGKKEAGEGKKEAVELSLVKAKLGPVSSRAARSARRI